MGILMVGPIPDCERLYIFTSWLRKFWWFNTGLIGLSFIMVVFMFPETNWHRVHPNEVGMNPAEKGSSFSVIGNHVEDGKTAGTTIRLTYPILFHFSLIRCQIHGRAKEYLARSDEECSRPSGLPLLDHSVTGSVLERRRRPMASESLR